MVAGQIGISVSPNLNEFHTKIRDAVRDANDLKVDIDVDVDAYQLDDLEDKVDQLDGRSIELKVDVDEKELEGLRRRVTESLKIDLDLNAQTAEDTYSNFKRNIEDGSIDARMRLQVDEGQVRAAAREVGLQSVTVDGVMDLDDTEARRRMEEFQEDFNIIHTWLLVHTGQAEDDLNDFRDQQAEQAIKQRVTFELGSPLKMPAMPSALPNMDGARNSMKGLGDEQWNVINMWGKMWDSMNQQIDAGIIQIYDKYRQMVVEAGNFLMKPGRGFMNILRNAETFQDVADGLTSAMQRFGNVAGDQLLNAAARFEDFTTAAQGAWDKMRPIDDIRLRFMALGDAISQGAGAARKHLGAIGGYASDAAQRVGGSFRNVGRKITSPFVRAGETVRNTFNNAVLAATFSISRLDAETGGALSKVANSFRSAGRGISTVTRNVGRGLAQNLIHPFQTFQTVATASLSGVSKGLGSLLNGFKRVSDTIDQRIIPLDLYGTFTESGGEFLRWLGGWGKKAGNLLSSPFVAAGRKVSDSFGKMTAPITNAMTRIGSSASNLARNVGGQMDALGDRIAAPFQRLGATVGTSLAGVQNQAGRAFRSMGDRLGGFMTEGLSNNLRRGMTRVGGLMSDTLASAAGSRLGKAFSGIGSRVSSAMARSMGDKGAFKAVSAVFGRIGSYAAGFGRIATGAFAKVASTLMSSLVPALMAAAAGMGLMAGQVAITAVLALGSAIGSVVQGAALMAPALVAAAGISFAALKLGLEGVGEAVGSAFSAETVAEFEEAMAGLPASVQGVARAFRSFKPAMDEMKTAVQDNLLEGLGPGIERAMNNLFPLLSSSLQSIASEWNGALKMGLDQLSSAEASNGLAIILDNTTEAAQNMQPVLSNLMRAFGSLAEQGSNWLPQLGNWMTDITQSFGDWAEGLREINSETGVSEFDTKMQNAVESAKLLGAVLGGLGGTIRNIFSAGSEGGGGLMVMMAEGAQALNEATAKGTENYAKMVEFFSLAADAARKLGEVISPIFGIVLDIASVLMNIASGAIPGIGAALSGLESGLQPLKDAAFDFGENLSRGIESLAPALSHLGGIAAPLLAGIGEGLGNLGEAVGPALDTIFAALVPLAEAFGPLFATVGTEIGNIFIALEPIITSTIGVLTAMAPVLQNIFGWFGTLGTAIVEALTPLFVGHDEGMQNLLANLNPVIDALGNGLLGVIEILAPYMPIIAAGFALIVDAIAAMLPLLPPVIDFVMNVLKHVIGFIAPIAGVILGIWGAVKLVTGAMAIFNTIMIVAKGVITGARIAMAIFNLVMNANPIARIITAVIALIGVFVYFFTQTETGRKIWETVMSALRTAWEKFTGAIQWTWENIIQPVWEGIKIAAGILFAVVSTVLITPFILAWNFLSWVIQAAWNNVIKPTWDLISQGALWLWENGIRPVIDWIINAWNTLAEWIRIGWEKIKYYWDLMGATIRGLWDMHVRPILDAIGGKWNEMKDRIAQGWQVIRDNVITPFSNKIRELWDIYVRPITDWISEKWENLKDRMSNAWNTIKTNVFDAFGNTLTRLEGWFNDTVDNIGKKWDTLKRLMAVPINWAIEHVFNNGIRVAWNAVAGLVNLGTLDPAPLIGEFANGGVLNGYSPGVDNHMFYSPTGGRIALSGGEAIMRPEWTRAVGGPRAVERMNADAKRGKAPINSAKPTLTDDERRNLRNQHRHANGGVVDLGGFAGGGVLDAMNRIVGQKYPQLVPMFSGYRPGGPYHGTSQAGDFSNGMDNTPAQNALAWDIAQTYPGSAELIYESPGFDKQIKHGSYVGSGGGSYGFYAGAGNHRNHVHWAMTTPPTMPFGGGVFEGGSDGGGGGFWQSITGTVKRLWDAAIDLIPSFPGADSMGEFGKVPGAWLKTQATAAWDYIKGIADTIMEFIGGGSSGSVDIDGITGPVVDQVEQVFARHGFTGADWDAAKWIIQKESNWDPRATNPSSGAFGLFQFNPMGGDTLGTYLPSRSTDPAVQADAGARYIKDRYGTPTAAKSFWEANGWYDQGGEARGVGIMQKGVIAPERILSPEQTGAFNAFVFSFMPELIRSYKNRPFELRQAVNEIIDGWNGIQIKADAKRNARIDALSNNMTDAFRTVSTGGRIETGREIRINELTARFANRDPNAISIDQLLSDGRFLGQWWNRNSAQLQQNISSAAHLSGQVIRDPHAYLEAEQAAKDRLDEIEKQEAEEASQKAQEERQAADEAERAARDEERNALLEGLSEEQKELKQAEFDREDKERDEQKKLEDDRIREQERAEQERIDELKATGEYYYGYKVFGDDGSNPLEQEDSEQVAEGKRYASEAADFAGVSDAYEGVTTRLNVLQSLGRNIEIAIPAWIAAANGNTHGLAHNIAVAQAANMDRTREEAQKLGPSALFGAIEMIASGTSQTAPFIGQVNSGMTSGELNATLTHYEARRARQIGGTSRLR